MSDEDRPSRENEEEGEDGNSQKVSSAGTEEMSSSVIVAARMARRLMRRQDSSSTLGSDTHSPVITAATVGIAARRWRRQPMMRSQSMRRPATSGPSGPIKWAPQRTTVAQALAAQHEAQRLVQQAETQSTSSTVAMPAPITGSGAGDSPLLEPTKFFSSRTSIRRSQIVRRHMQQQGATIFESTGSRQASLGEDDYDGRLSAETSPHARHPASRQHSWRTSSFKTRTTTPIASPARGSSQILEEAIHAATVHQTQARMKRTVAKQSICVHNISAKS